MHKRMHQVDSRSMLGVGEAEHALRERRQHPLGERRKQQPLVIGDARWVIGARGVQPAATVAAEVQQPVENISAEVCIGKPDKDNGKKRPEKRPCEGVEQPAATVPAAEVQQPVVDTSEKQSRQRSREKSMSCPPVGAHRSAEEMFSQTSTRQMPFRRCSLFAP
jgi:hypothetical protein